MKKWVLLIFGINESLDKRCEVLEHRIEKLSLSSAMPADKMYSAIIALSNKKADLINLRVMYNLMVESLSGDERLVLEKLADKRRRKRESELLKKRNDRGIRHNVCNRLNGELRKNYSLDVLSEDDERHMLGEKMKDGHCGNEGFVGSEECSVRGGIRGLGVRGKTLAEIFEVCKAAIAEAGYSVEKLERTYPDYVSRLG